MGTLRTVSTETPDSGNWKAPLYKPGEDDLWDRLGSDWQRIDGVSSTQHVYVRWHKPEGERPKVTGFCVVADPVTTEGLRAVPISRLENLARLMDDPMSADQFFTELTPLQRRKGEPPEEFSERVAWYYRVFSVTSSKPTKDLAEHSGVPLSTMRSWIREARLRGHLPPGTPGKSG